MNLLLVRKYPFPNCVIGELSIDGAFECFSLEDIEREVKVPGKTAIPRGRYRVTMDFSARFQKIMPRLMNVPGFSGVRIHSGNTAADTEGCVLVGEEKGEGRVLHSRIAYGRLFPKLLSAFDKAEPIFIDIKGEGE